MSESRKLVFMDSTSSKFWNITLDGSSHTVNYGRTGSAGQSKTKDFDSPEAAKKDFDKMVASKLKKGYVDGEEQAAGTDSDGDGTADGVLPAVAFHATMKAGYTYKNVGTFVGKRVQTYDPEKGAAKGGNTIYRFSSDWDEEDRFEKGLNQFLAGDAAAEATGIVIGAWGAEMFEETPEKLIKKLVEHRERLPQLNALFFGDISLEECEMSWIQQSDVSPLFAAFPNLEMFRVRGGGGLELKDNKHPKLRGLAIEAGGLGGNVVRSVLTGDFPNLEHLELWLGTEEYGGSSSVQDLQPLLSGELFPKLHYLGLRNCDYADDIAGVIVNAPIVKRIEFLDLSLGTLSDTGAAALLNLPTDGALKRVSIHHHFCSDGMVKKLEALPFQFDTTGGEDPEDDWRFVSVGE